MLPTPEKHQAAVKAQAAKPAAALSSPVQRLLDAAASSDDHDSQSALALCTWLVRMKETLPQERFVEVCRVIQQHTAGSSIWDLAVFPTKTLPPSLAVSVTTPTTYGGQERSFSSDAAAAQLAAARHNTSPTGPRTASFSSGASMSSQFEEEAAAIWDAAAKGGAAEQQDAAQLVLMLGSPARNGAVSHAVRSSSAAVAVSGAASTVATAAPSVATSALPSAAASAASSSSSSSSSGLASPTSCALLEPPEASARHFMEGTLREGADGRSTWRVVPEYTSVNNGPGKARTTQASLSWEVVDTAGLHAAGGVPRTPQRTHALGDVASVAAQLDDEAAASDETRESRQLILARPDCGTCQNCLDKPKFGGQHRKRQACVHKLALLKEIPKRDPSVAVKRRLRASDADSNSAEATGGAEDEEQRHPLAPIQAAKRARLSGAAREAEISKLMSPGVEEGASILLALGLQG